MSHTAARDGCRPRNLIRREPKADHEIDRQSQLGNSTKIGSRRLRATSFHLTTESEIDTQSQQDGIHHMWTLSHSVLCDRPSRPGSSACWPSSWPTGYDVGRRTARRSSLPLLPVQPDRQLTRGSILTRCWAVSSARIIHPRRAARTA